jgi:hypothetical protein
VSHLVTSDEGTLQERRKGAHVQLFLGLGEEGISPRFGERRELLKIYRIVYGTLLR